MNFYLYTFRRKFFYISFAKIHFLYEISANSFYFFC